ncbi:hypothetical protein SBOR_6168 [Sclerotinia borealis F-4128]|uniref:C2H2-type domain-containing protein n=1 Tax=Sclerotinia borealis (strain F-4128) TaxID=1432307 RepID=W9CC69_SCLBF|nr:hypothetical protein SBOR_6168 [Sclerotinia borealis F-4128]
MLVYHDSEDSYSISPPTSTLTKSASDPFNSSWDTSLQLQAGTPVRSSTHSTSYDETVKMENLSFQNQHGFPYRSGNTNDNAFCAMSTMTQEMFQESNMFFGVDDGKILNDANPTLTYNTSFQGYSPAAFGSFDSQCPSSDIPSLMDDLYSPTSTSESLGAMDFVDPTQTTLINTFADFQSSPIGPITPIKFGTPSSNFNTPRSYNNSHAAHSTPGYLTPPNYQCFGHDPISPIRYFGHDPITPIQQQQRRMCHDSPQSTSALQRIQAATPTKQTTRRKIKQESLPIKVESRASLLCPYDGCPGKFVRQEHLKRHKKTHDIKAKKYKCPFCEEKPKSFGRTDNLKAHFKLHTQKVKKGARTKYHPDALKAYEAMSKKSRKHDVFDIKDLPVRTRLSGY